VKKIIALLFITVLIYFTGCEDKKCDSPEENTTGIVTKTCDIVDTNKSTLKTNKDAKNFKLYDIDNKDHTIYFDKKNILIEDVSQNFVLLNFFATWCPPCQGQIPYLADLKEKYKKENDTFAVELLKELNIAERFQLPLTILYKNDKYYTHYEGAVPIEMIEHDLKKAIGNKE